MYPSITDYELGYECIFNQMFSEWRDLLDDRSYNGTMTLTAIFMALPKCQHLSVDKDNPETFCRMIPVLHSKPPVVPDFKYYEKLE